MAPEVSSFSAYCCVSFRPSVGLSHPPQSVCNWGGLSLPIFVLQKVSGGKYKAICWKGKHKILKSMMEGVNSWDIFPRPQHRFRNVTFSFKWTVSA